MALANEEIVSGFDQERDDSLKIEISRVSEVPGGLYIALTGYIDTYNSSSFQKRVSRAINAGFIRMIFDCTGLNYVSSTGIGSFTAFMKSVKSLNGDLVLISVQNKVFEVFQLLGFSQFFNIRDSRDDAVAYLLNNKNTPAAGGAFPRIFDCPICGKKLKAVKSGRFRCSECKTILSINEEGQVFLG
jgi:anti-anti-sigma factor